MAKKKSKKTKKKAHKKTTHKKPKKQKHVTHKKKKDKSSVGYIIGIIIILVAIILLLSLKGCEKAPVEEDTTDTTDTEVPTIEEVSEGDVTTIDYCSEENALGFKPRCTKTDDGIEIDVVRSGTSDLKGLWFEYIDVEGNKEYVRYNKAIAQGESVMINLDQKDAIKIMIYSQNDDGALCKNQVGAVLVANCK